MQNVLMLLVTKLNKMSKRNKIICGITALISVTVMIMGSFDPQIVAGCLTISFCIGFIVGDLV